MKVNILLIIGLLFLSVTSSRAQDIEREANIIESLERYEPGQGRVKIHQSQRITELIGNRQIAGTGSGSSGSYTTTGYRIQIYSGSNTRESRDEANRLAAKVKEYLPEQKVYTLFNPPRWVTKVGNFRSMEEANVVLRELKSTGLFKEITILRNEQVTIYY